MFVTFTISLRDSQFSKMKTVSSIMFNVPCLQQRHIYSLALSSLLTRRFPVFNLKIEFTVRQVVPFRISQVYMSTLF
jgi:hypothetical protein